MDFLTTQFFLFFVLIFFFAIQFKSEKKNYKILILIANIFFYSLFGFKNLLILLISLIINYLLLKLLESKGTKIFKGIIKSETILSEARIKREKKAVLSFIMIFNIAFLVFFKYSSNIIASFLKIELFKNSIPINFEILAPIGVSFYTFRLLSLAIDLYNKKLYLPRFIDYINYVMFFPQIISGPIVKAGDYFSTEQENQAIENSCEYSRGEIFTGILFGFFKKFLIASLLYDFVYGTFSAPANFSWIDLFFGALGYSAMLYADFSGYSDISIALAKLLGFSAPVNFNMPYQALGFKDFWRRWHISLSDWFKTYVYIPLGGNKEGQLRKYVNILITMSISGLWHGLTLNFIIWGFIHTIGSVISNIIEDITKKHPLSTKVTKIFVPVGIIMTFLSVTFSWIFFNSKDFDTAKIFINNILNFNKTNINTVPFVVILLIIIVILLNFFETKLKESLQKILNEKSIVVTSIIIFVLFYLILKFGPDTVPPFIYFSF